MEVREVQCIVLHIACQGLVAERLFWQSKPQKPVACVCMCSWQPFISLIGRIIRVFPKFIAREFFWHFEHPGDAAHERKAQSLRVAGKSQAMQVSTQ